MTKPLRVSIIGCGKVAQIHAAALKALPEAALVAVCDVDAERAHTFAQRHGAAEYTDVSQMIERSHAEVAIICTPHPLHSAGAIAAARAGAHVLVEKPLATTVEDCDAMISAAEENHVRLGVVSQRRFFPPVIRMRQAIDAGKIGHPVLGTVEMLSWRDEAYYQSDPWRGKWSTEGGGVLINQSPHHIDILQWLMGPAVEVTSYWANLNHPYVEVEDTALAMIRFAGGGLASVTVSLCQKPGIYTKIHIHGSNGASVGAETDTGATFVAGMSEPAGLPFNDVWTIPGEEHEAARFRAEDATALAGIDPVVRYHALQDQEFLEAVAANRAPGATGEDGRRVVELIAAIYRSQRDRNAVALSAR